MFGPPHFFQKLMEFHSASGLILTFKPLDGFSNFKKVNDLEFCQGFIRQVRFGPPHFLGEICAHASIVGFNNDSEASEYLEIYLKLMKTYYSANLLKINADKTTPV